MVYTIIIYRYSENSFPLDYIMVKGITGRRSSKTYTVHVQLRPNAPNQQLSILMRNIIVDNLDLCRGGFRGGGAGGGRPGGQDPPPPPFFFGGGGGAGPPNFIKRAKTPRYST